MKRDNGAIGNVALVLLSLLVLSSLLRVLWQHIILPGDGQIAEALHQVGDIRSRHAHLYTCKRDLNYM